MWLTNRKGKNIKENLSHVKKKDASKSEDCCITGGCYFDINLQQKSFGGKMPVKAESPYKQ